MRHVRWTKPVTSEGLAWALWVEALLYGGQSPGVLLFADFDESKHHRGQPKNKGQFGPGGGGGQSAKSGEGGSAAPAPYDPNSDPALQALMEAEFGGREEKGGRAKPKPKSVPQPTSNPPPVGGKIQQQAAAIVGGKLTPVNDRAFSGKPSDSAGKISKQLAGAIGEEVVVQWLKDQGFTDAGHLSDYLQSERNNLPADLIHDHQIVEVKAGQASNGAGAQQWRLTIGEPGAEEKKFLAAASPEEKAAYNAKKQQAIHERKKQAIANVSKELGYKVKGKTMTTVIDPSRGVADLYAFDGFHDRIGWNSEQAKAGYLGSYRYGK